ncbi:MAG: ATP-dependent helicase [Tetrasphaera sp.]|nr:ATP-dependent helicase [Tetrasphaera sp.]
MTRRPARAEAPVLDAAQQRVIDHRGPLLTVLGAPGTGKSLVAVELLASRVRTGELTPDECLLLAPTRLAAARLRDAVTARVGGTGTEPLARSHQSLGFGILRRDAARRGEPPPRLLAGPEQEVVLRDILAGHASGEVPGPRWPNELREALPTRSFRGELRDLLIRAAELGLGPEDLERLGGEYDRPAWVAAAAVLEEYEQVTALSAAGAYDPASILDAAAAVLDREPARADEVVARWRLVVVDDAQELTPSAARLLLAVQRASAADLVLLADPDSATQTFRGADPRLALDTWPQAPRRVLATGHRLSAGVHGAVRAVAAHIGSAGELGHRATGPAHPGGSATAYIVRSAAQEGMLIGERLRQAHLHRGLPWSQMAVIVRGASRSAALRRSLAVAGVPVAPPRAEVPIQDEAAVRPFLNTLAVALDLELHGLEPAPHVVVELLQSAVGGADAVTLRRLRRALRESELRTGGGRGSDELLVEAVLLPGSLADIGAEGAPARRVGRVLAAARGALSTPGAGAESVLWAMWQASGLASSWRATALAGGAAGARADADLDAVLTLFALAARFVERLPGASVESFLDRLAGEDVPGDSLAASGTGAEVVQVLTPAAAAGRQWSLVAVAGVQEGVWPDQRVRGTLLGTSDLVDLVTGRGGGVRAALTAVRHDETRLFHVALSRATSEVIVVAVQSLDEQPSPFLGVVDPPPGGVPRQFTDPAPPLTLRGAVAQLRREVVSPDPSRRGPAVNALARLAREGVPGAEPTGWWQASGLSTDRPRRAPGIPVSVSPSRVESFGQCQLRWFLTASGGDGPGVGSADIGRLVHGIAHDFGDDADGENLTAAVLDRWPTLGLPRGWLSDRKREQAIGMVLRLARYTAEVSLAGWRRVGTELDLEVALGRALIRGRVDRLEADQAGALRVVDLKTGSTKPGPAEVARHPQLGVYQLAIQAGAFPGHGVSAGAALLQLGKASNVATTLQVQPPLVDDEAPQWAAELVESTAEAMAGATFTATPDTWCRLCPVRSSCPALAEGRVLE